MRWIISLLLTHISVCVFCQTDQADSLIKILPTVRDDSTRVEVLRVISEQLTFNDQEKALSYIREALRIGKSIPLSNLRRVYNRYAIVLTLKGDYDSALLFYTRILDELKNIDNPLGLISVYNSMGTVYMYKNDNNTALKYFFNALDVAEKNNLSSAISYGNIAKGFHSAGNLLQALKYDSLAILAAEKEGHEQTKYILMGNMAALLIGLKKVERAEELLLSAVDFYRRKHLRHLLANDLQTLCELKFMQNSLDAAYTYGSEGLNIFQSLGSRLEAGEVHQVLAHVEFSRLRIDEAKAHAMKAFTIADSLRLLNKKLEAAKLLMKLSYYDQQYKAATHYDSLTEALEDSISRRQERNFLNELQTKYETEKRARENEMLKKNNIIQEAEINRQKTVIISVIIGAAILTIFLVYLFRSYKFKIRTNELLQRKNDEIELQSTHIASQSERIRLQNDELTMRINELRVTQSKLVQSEKMASLGQLTAGIAHEINNPVNFIKVGVEALKENIESVSKVLNAFDSVNVSNVSESLPRIESLKQKVGFSETLEDIPRLMDAIYSGSIRTAAIVSNLQKFSRHGGDNFIMSNVNAILQDTLNLVNGELKDGVHVITRFGDVNCIYCNPIELGQVFLNIIMNAVQAIKHAGEIQITTNEDDRWIVVTIADNGPGISPNHLNQIFDPFFTTKDIGEGTGLGLSISHGIVSAHQGTIEVSNQPGGGAEFKIKLPNNIE